ncbi:uncharacterized protein LOC116175858 [Photinus pyralis]|uniref:uncharacterized protein LOC116175858 n=1 Tax=Photinus pyralis TaxID=7054 RepID=UPI0012676418|nr:uncharacterized protein LOC116175858 [Photinus pyralis]
MEVLSEKIEGFQSKISFKCNVCNIVQIVNTENPNKKDFPTNCAVVAGAISIGVGYSQINEFVSCLNIPNMSNATYLRYHSNLSKNIHDENIKLMNTAAQEERRLAVESGHVSEQGVPIIPVIVDGAWSKRSYRTNYNALSGVACIIGAKTKKILYMGVKNKYCFVCTRASTPVEHSCFKNWDRSSTAMEAEIIAEGFQSSIKSHNLIYGKIIGDGDSTVYKKVVEVSPYGPTFVVEKIECRNHLIRNYINKISELSKDTKFPIHLRRIVTNTDVLGRFRNAITKAIAFRKQGPDAENTKVALLKKDIENGPNHIFGDHSNCDGYFCCGNKDQENLVPTLKLSGIFEPIVTANRRLANNAASLLQDVDTNAAESYNSVVAKFVGGKRINYSLKNSYQTRCEAASISYNTGGGFLAKVQERMCGTIDHYTRIFHERKMRRVHVNRKKAPKRKHFATADSHYGPSANQPEEDMDSELYKKKTSRVPRSFTMCGQEKDLYGNGIAIKVQPLVSRAQKTNYRFKFWQSL